MKEHKWRWISLLLVIALIISIWMQMGELNKTKNLQEDILNRVAFAIQDFIWLQESILYEDLDLGEKEKEILLLQISEGYGNQVYSVAESFEGSKRIDLHAIKDLFEIAMQDFIDAESKEEAIQANMDLRELRNNVLQLYDEYF
ncbi:hypothetical protein [Ureibacillus acetophenoni]|uniref:Uncharacterized protein n=1 Tax=Ureibacillus acetophenoni TaxID=614649 RepID=A0A285UDD2_9BACL|nr:hypothetical protein [Ureibacillus acetophenoni]SOC39944.1 hypothetical protein SAMN05877842_106200 [Ureibacillus acetophenoni]